MIPTRPNTLAKYSLDSLYRQALVQMPDLSPDYVYLPTQPGKNFFVRGTVQSESPIWGSQNAIEFNALTGKPARINRVAKESFWQKIEATFYSLHIGSYGGLPVRILYVIVGLTPGILSITGFMLWLRRRKPLR